MKLNMIKPADGASRKKDRVGRGIGSGFGKTAGRGHKGQRARKGGRGKTGFEGGQMPIQRRLPKRGFRSQTSDLTAQVRLSAIDKLPDAEIDLAALLRAGLIAPTVRKVKVIKTGTLNRKVEICGLSLTKGAREAVVAAGGSVRES